MKVIFICLTFSLATQFYIWNCFGEIVHVEFSRGRNWVGFFFRGEDFRREKIPVGESYVGKFFMGVFSTGEFSHLMDDFSGKIFQEGGFPIQFSKLSETL